MHTSGNWINDQLEVPWSPVLRLVKEIRLKTKENRSRQVFLVCKTVLLKQQHIIKLWWFHNGSNWLRCCITKIYRAMLIDFPHFLRIEHVIKHVMFQRNVLKLILQLLNQSATTRTGLKDIPSSKVTQHSICFPSSLFLTWTSADGSEDLYWTEGRSEICHIHLCHSETLMEKSVKTCINEIEVEMITEQWKSSACYR